ncbi:hypothetical protein L208DRAFT_1382553 [Tricholoma matsutake]|nr:hypothetical protein L208DRAFT_1382553 [Tricholoma matsutake 945]
MSIVLDENGMIYSWAMCNMFYVAGFYINVFGGKWFVDYITKNELFTKEERHELKKELQSEMWGETPELDIREEDVHAMLEFVNMIMREAKDLKKESFGAKLLYIIGNTYKHGTTKKFLKNVMTSRYTALQASKLLCKLEYKGTMEAWEHQALMTDVAGKTLHPEALYDRAKAIPLIGEIFISVSESPEEELGKESRILERIVMGGAKNKPNEKK